MEPNPADNQNPGTAPGDENKNPNPAQPDNQDPNSQTPSDPVKEAIEEERKKKRPEIDRAAHSLKSNAERLKQLGGDPAAVLGLKPKETPPLNLDEEEDDNKPLTRGDLKRMERERNQQTALELANDIENEDERELAKIYLKTRIIPSNDPHADLAAAMSIVNSVKNRKVSEEIERKNALPPRRHITGSGNPAYRKDAFQATEEELAAARIARVKPAEIEQWITERRKGKEVVFGTAAKKKREAEAKNR